MNCGKDGYITPTAVTCEGFTTGQVVEHLAPHLLSYRSLLAMRHKPSLTRSTFPSECLGGSGRFVMHRQPSRLNFSYHCLMLFFTGPPFCRLCLKTSLNRHNRLCSCVLKHAQSLLCNRRRHFYSTCSPGGHRRN